MGHMNGDDWITTQEAAELSGYHVNYLRKLIRRGDIEGRKVSIVWLIQRQSLLSYMAQAEQSDDKRRGPKPT
jgi:excisionase family DNA binding protein